MSPCSWQVRKSVVRARRRRRGGPASPRGGDRGRGAARWRQRGRCRRRHLAGAGRGRALDERPWRRRLHADPAGGRQPPMRSIAAWWRRAASIPPTTRWPEAWPATCSAGPPWSSTATCTARWRWRSPASPTACASPTSGSAPCRWSSWSHPAVALAEEGFAVDWYATQMVAGAAAELRRYPHAAALWLPVRPAAGPALDRRDRPAAADGACRHLARPRRRGPARLLRGCRGRGPARRLRRARRADRCRRPRRLPGAADRAARGRLPLRPRCWPCLAPSPAAASPAAWSCCGRRPWARGADAEAFEAYAPRPGPGLPRAARRRRSRPLLHLAPQRRRPPRQPGGADPDAALHLRQQAARPQDRAAAQQRRHVVRPAARPRQLAGRRRQALVEHVPGDRPGRRPALRPRRLGRAPHPARGAADRLVPARPPHEPGGSLPPASARRQRPRPRHRRRTAAGRDRAAGRRRCPAACRPSPARSCSPAPPPSSTTRRRAGARA